MNSVISPSSLLPLQSFFRNSAPCWHSRPHTRCFFGVSPIGLSSVSLKSSSTSLHTSHGPQSFISAVTPSNEESIPVMTFEDFGDKDWSFLDMDIKGEAERIIKAGLIGEESKVLVSIGSEGFVDRVVESCPSREVVVVHDSLLVLACIKEKYDYVTCWQAELIYVPEEWAPFDVVFLYFLPALPFEIGQIFGALAKVCSPGARIVISHPKGREVLEQQKKQYPDVIVSNLPDKMTLESLKADHPFELIEFVDEPYFYLAQLTYQGVAK